MDSSSYVRFDDLMPSTEYAARFWTVTNGTANRATDARVHSTLDKAHVPDQIGEIQISGFNSSTNNNSTKTTEMLLTWERSKGIQMRVRLAICSRTYILDRAAVHLNQLGYICWYIFFSVVDVYKHPVYSSPWHNSTCIGVSTAAT